MNIKEININKILTIFLLSHLSIWTLIPFITNNNLPLDTIEVLAWGSNLDWGFSKHPPLSAFFAEIFYQIFGSRDWAYYLLSQIFVTISFFVVWKVSTYIFEKKIYGLISVLLLEGIYFYNYTTPEFNVYICELPFLALTVLFCWKGFENNKTSDWLLFGLFSALGVLSHYLFVYLLTAIDLFLLYMFVKKKINLKCLISLITFFLVLLPHLLWIVENDFTTFTYGLHRTGAGDKGLLDHIYHPIVFLGKQAGILLPLFLMVLFLVSKFKINFNFKDKKLLFLLTINIIPIILIFLTSMIMGVKIRTMWMTPFYLFLGVFIVYIFHEQINLRKLKNFVTLFLVLFIFSPFAYAYVSITQTDKRTDYDGKEIADTIQKIWDNKYNSRIKYVKGDEWHAGNLSYHLKSRPKWLAVSSDEIIPSKNIMLPNEIKIPVKLYGDK